MSDMPNADIAPRRTCGAGTDGDCYADGCPQNRDGEPAASGRSCPLPTGNAWIALREADEVEPAWCPHKGRCAHPDCLTDLERCASALMAAGPRRKFPASSPPRRPRRIPPVSTEEADRG